uniref:Uncharacterized protein n=1 Tax=Glossina morsitans morsitans TaxID=37546 RepID=A0A1B0GBW9_GLOMM
MDRNNSNYSELSSSDEDEELDEFSMSGSTNIEYENEKQSTQPTTMSNLFCLRGEKPRMELDKKQQTNIVQKLINREGNHCFTSETNGHFIMRCQIDYRFVLNKFLWLSPICVTNLRLLFYAWILSSQILSNMHLMQKLFSIFLTQEIDFVIEKAQVACPSLDIKADKDVTLVEAGNDTSTHYTKIGRLTSAQMDDSSRISKRTAIYNLSIPGGYPTNWNDLSAQCLAIMNEFIKDLAPSI